MGLRIQDLTKEYGDTTALSGVSFEIPDGSFAVVLGESGAGKSTLLRILNGLTEPTSGGVYLDGQEITNSRSDVGMVFQQHNLADELSAYDNALTGTFNRTGFVRSLLNLQPVEDRELALEALETVGLLDEAGQRVDRMSGGQQQRVGIARALVQQPALLLADEPVASLDPASAEAVMTCFRETAKKRDLTTLASLHQVNIAREFGEQFIGLKDGEVMFVGSRSELTPSILEEIYGEIQTEELREGTETPDSNEPTQTNASDIGARL
ncbi:phosphonate ABC transporter ATP-binding protein [Halorubrum lipolyticum]|uniref:Phosphate/phosphonate ABC transporter ATP-binding protein n=1 Tax=Halorubrum lipolyticum DSM 21995 TaxID=1227482 RepID=M0NL32_9EURY|nr:phosphonate ABC transporter ATP-binding protein [Halorubrum lipolyticum]EMA58667.1 phosphate/phosphonate ABC transporter ATP-binding protein [Halorubrum lipolyticum DSM 21995]